MEKKRVKFKKKNRLINRKFGFAAKKRLGQKKRFWHFQARRRRRGMKRKNLLWNRKIGGR